ncbi:MAG: type II toxin-antitoxin system Phd/YefM family antitoxin [Acidimicrobiia bacterium]|jgi:prevent-host-death family protein|nr:type II toxin-antitoxin system Phd/YefM family antitoxin [Acidimicrobiia bacterium]
MTKQVNVAEAKAHLSQLLEDAAAGEDIVIARAGRPVARLVPLAEPALRPLGFLPLVVDDSLFAPLTDDELAAWEA